MKELKEAIKKVAHVSIPTREVGLNPSDVEKDALYEITHPEYPFMDTELIIQTGYLEGVIIWRHKKTKATTIHIDAENSIEIPKKIVRASNTRINKMCYGGNKTMKATVFDQNHLIKIRYSNDNERSEILKALSTVPGLEVDDRGYKG